MTKEEFIKKEIEKQREIEKSKVFKEFRVVVYEQKKSGGYPFTDFETDNFYEAVSFAKKMIQQQKNYRPDSEYLWVTMSKFTKIEERGNVRYPYYEIARFGEEDLETSKYEFGGDFQSGVYAKGGSLESHGIKEGDTFLKTISGAIQKVKDKNGNIFYINLATGERDTQPPLPFDDGGEVKYFLNKDGIRVRSKVEPKEKLSEAEWMAKHSESKEARGYAFGGFFSKSKETVKPSKYPKLEGKQVMLKNGKMVQVFEQFGSTITVVELGKMGSGETPHSIDISEVDMTSFANGGGVEKFKVGDKVKIEYISDNSRHNNKIGTITWLNEYNYYPNGDYSVIKKKTQGIITYEDGSEEEVSDFYAKGSGITSPIKKVSFATGGRVKMNTEVILSENRPNGAEWQGVVKPFMLKSIEENQYAGGFKRYEIDIYDEVKREPTKEEIKKANEFFDKIGGRYASGGGVEKISFEDWLKKNNIEVYKRTYYWVADDGGSDYMYSGSKGDVMKSLREDYKKSFANGGGVGLIGNQSKIDMNKNGKIDAEDFEIMRNTMDGAWRKDRKYVNSTSRKNGKVIDYEVRYARKNKPSRKGYKGKTNYADGGGLNEDVSVIYVDNYPYYIKKMDSTHFRMANSKDGVDIVIPSHILQHRGESYFEDVRSWLKGGANPNGKKYETNDSYATGGGVSKFEKLSNRVAKNYEGKRVKPQYQKEYGKVYSKEEAKEVGDKVAGKVKANQKMATGGETKKGAKGGIMVLAKKIRKDGESWQDALKRAGQQLK